MSPLAFLRRWCFGRRVRHDPAHVAMRLAAIAEADAKPIVLADRRRQRRAAAPSGSG